MTRKIVLIMLMIAAVCGTALAKGDPYFEDPTSEWGDVSQPVSVWSTEAAVQNFGLLETYGDVDAFTYTFDQPLKNWPVELIVPACGEHFAALYPSVAVIGPGLDAPESGALPFDLPEGVGAQVFNTPPSTNLSRMVSQNSNSVGIDAYIPGLFNVPIPEAGTYTLAVWEPNGNMGAYALVTGTHRDMFASRSDVEWTAAIRKLETGSWMEQDCAAPLAAASCPVTQGSAQTTDIPDAPQRAQVGEGFVLTGQVLDTATCLPVSEAQVTYWLVNEQGEYDADHEGFVLTNAQGRYRIESNRPGSYGPPPHIHVGVIAPGYETLITEILLEADDLTQGTLDINVTAQS